MKREVRCIYCAIFKVQDSPTNIIQLIKFYDDYEEFRHKILENKSAPSTIKTQLVPIMVPQYIEWVRKYLVKDNG